jgi:hypothetical protein
VIEIQRRWALSNSVTSLRSTLGGRGGYIPSSPRPADFLEILDLDLIAASAVLLLAAAPASSQTPPQLVLQGVTLDMTRAQAADAAIAAGGRCDRVGVPDSLAPLLCGFGGDRLRVAFVPGPAGHAIVRNVTLLARSQPPHQIDVERLQPSLLATYGTPVELRQTRVGFEACWVQDFQRLTVEAKPRLLSMRLDARDPARESKESECR